METKKESFFKILIVGDAEIGKSNILSKYWQDKFDDKYKATIGADFYTKDIVIDEETITLQIWDTAGQERFQSLGVGRLLII